MGFLEAFEKTAREEMPVLRTRKQAAANANWEEPTSMVPMPGKKGVEAMAQPPMWPSGVSPIAQSTFVD